MTMSSGLTVFVHNSVNVNDENQSNVAFSEGCVNQVLRGVSCEYACNLNSNCIKLCCVAFTVWNFIIVSCLILWWWLLLLLLLPYCFYYFWLLFIPTTFSELCRIRPLPKSELLELLMLEQDILQARWGTSYHTTNDFKTLKKHWNIE